jgi:hypothetical protein
MVRDSLAANAKNALMAVSPGNGVTFQYRTATGGASANTGTPGLAAPLYVELTRAGNTLSGYYSADGVNYTLQGSVDIAMGSTVYVGLAVTSHHSGALSNSAFDTVSFAGAVGLPPGWGSQDVGPVGQAGGASFDGAGTFSVGGAGADIGGTSDAFRYVYQTLTGDGTLLARVAGQDYTSDSAKAGVMIRASLAPGDPEALMAVTPGNGVAFEYRTAGGGDSTLWGTPGPTAPVYVAISRAGNTLTGSYSTDGVNWVQQGSVDIALGPTVYVGLAVTSDDPTTVGNAAFDSLYASGLIGPVTGPYTTLAIPGAPALSLGAGTGIAVSWAAVPGSTGYAVERSSDGATWSQAGTTAAGVTTFNDNNLTGSFRYFYRVSALSPGGRSAPSGVASLVNRPGAPFNVTVASFSTSQLVVNWRDVSGDTGYRVERSLDGVNFTSVGTVGTNRISLSNTGLAAGTTYYYRVAALSPQGDSPYSAVASGTTRAGGSPPPAPPGDGGGSPHHLIDLGGADVVTTGDVLGPGPGATPAALPSVHALLHADAAGAGGAAAPGDLGGTEHTPGTVGPAFGLGRALTMAGMGEAGHLVTSPINGATAHLPWT